jgi:very-short-patch-repair endonuclease
MNAEQSSPISRSQKTPAKLLQRAQELRQQQTHTEQLLWNHLRNRQLCNAKFRRQHNIDRFITDFYCHSAALVIEVDGEIHDHQKERDSDRDASMQSQGLTVLRFTNEEVLNDIDSVLKRIAQYLHTSS